MAAAINPATASASGTPAKVASFEKFVRSSSPSFRSMITKTNSTMIAPPYTMICTAATNSAPKQQVQARQRDHHHDERQRAVNRVPLQDQADRSKNRDSAASTKKMITGAVISAFPKLEWRRWSKPRSRWTPGEGTSSRNSSTGRSGSAGACRASRYTRTGT